MIGTLTVLLEKDTPTSVEKDAWVQMIFLIRTGMASGRYESSTVLKVIFVNDLTADSASTVSALSIYSPETETGTSSSTIVAIVLGVLLAITVGVAQYLFLKRAKKPVEEEHEEHAEHSSASSVSQVEDVWKKALDTYDSKGAVDPIGNFVVTSSDNCSVSSNGDDVEPSHAVEYEGCASDRVKSTTDPPGFSQEKVGDATNDCNPTEPCTPEDDDISDIIASCLPMECDASALTEQTAREDLRAFTDLSSMKISELKKELDIYGFDYSNLIEKQECE
jgi:hypothetical protein